MSARPAVCCCTAHYSAAMAASPGSVMVGSTERVRHGWGCPRSVFLGRETSPGRHVPIREDHSSCSAWQAGLCAAAGLRAAGMRARHARAAPPFAPPPPCLPSANSAPLQRRAATKQKAAGPCSRPSRPTHHRDGRVRLGLGCGQPDLPCEVGHACSSSNGTEWRSRRPFDFDTPNEVDPKGLLSLLCRLHNPVAHVAGSMLCMWGTPRGPGSHTTPCSPRRAVGPPPTPRTLFPSLASTWRSVVAAAQASSIAR